MLISKFTNNGVDSKIIELEKEYHIILSDQYKEFLRKYNGGYTPKTKFKCGKVASDIYGFYGVGDAKLNFNEINLNEWIMKGVFPIARDSFGNYIAIGLEESNIGKIFFCDHEKGNKKTLISENLWIFFKACKSEKISEASRLSIKEREEKLIANGRGHIITEDLKKMWQKEIDKYKDMIQEEVSFN